MSDFRVADWLARELGSAGRGAVLQNLVHEEEIVRCEYAVPGQPGTLVVICTPDSGIAGLAWDVRAYLNDPATSPIARTKTSEELVLGGVTASVAMPRDASIRAPDGRTIAIRLAGAEDGSLVIYMHGSPSSRLDVDYLHERSRRRGVRLVGIDRPGYGLSTPMPFTFASVAADAGLVADALGFPRFAVFGQSSGVAYALATAASLGPRVSAVATAGGAMPFTPMTSSFEQLSESERRGVTLAGIDDVEAERLLAEADLPFVRQLALQDDEIEAAWMEMLPPADQRVFAAGLGRLIGPTMRESMRQGQVGWARDNLVRMPRWDFDPRTVTVPATVWIGLQDAANVEGARWLHGEIPGVTLRELPDHGHFLAFELWEDVLDSLRV